MTTSEKWQQFETICASAIYQCIALAADSLPASHFACNSIICLLPHYVAVTRSHDIRMRWSDNAISQRQRFYWTFDRSSSLPQRSLTHTHTLPNTLAACIWLTILHLNSNFDVHKPNPSRTIRIERQYKHSRQYKRINVFIIRIKNEYCECKFRHRTELSQQLQQFRCNKFGERMAKRWSRIPFYAYNGDLIIKQTHSPNLSMSRLARETTTKERRKKRAAMEFHFRNEYHVVDWRHLNSELS